MRYFEFMPVINYSKVPVRDITRRSILRSTYINHPYVFLPYTIHPGERAIDIANVYYGSIDKTWVVLLSQKIIDPYYEWPMDPNQFADYLAFKYRLSAPEGVEAMEWTSNPLYTDNIICYALKTDDTIRISQFGYQNLPEGDSELYRPIRIFEAEENENNLRRNITLIDRTYLPQIEREIREQMSK